MKTLSLALAAAWAVAVSPTAAQDAPAERIAAGRQVFELHCVACHGAGPGVPPFDELAGTGALRTKYRGEKPAVLAERTDLTPAFVAYFVRHGISVMPFYRKTEISDAELAALGLYLSRLNPDVTSPSSSP